MSVVADLNDGTVEQIVTGIDSIVIVDKVMEKRGGTTLDVTGYAPEIIPAGHVLIKETSSGNYKPMPLTGSAYAALPAGHTYAGIVVASKLKKYPFVGVLEAGKVNVAAMVYPLGTIAADVKAALPLIIFTQD